MDFKNYLNEPIRNPLPPLPSLAKTLDRLEIIRAGLRWTSQLDWQGIQRVLRQINELKDEILILSGVKRFQQQLTAAPTGQLSPHKRRQALKERNFIFEGVFGDNSKLLGALETAEKASRTDLPILIQGQSGTGKELLARVIHTNSHRSSHPFISVNCGAIVPGLLESELFGHLKGSFTGAIKDRHGKFETASQGTLFLDEIGELPIESQVKLLRVLESGDIQRVGSDKMIRVNTRIIAATNRNLKEMMNGGHFRQDLYYRLSVISVTLPPLRERKDEIGLLTDYFCAEAAEKLNRQPVKFTPDLYRILMNHPYHGNIRELKNIIYRLSCLADEVADVRHLSEEFCPAAELPKASVPQDIHNLEEARQQAEKSFLEQHLQEVGGNVTKLAKQLEMNRSYVQTLLKKHGIRRKK